MKMIVLFSLLILLILFSPSLTQNVNSAMMYPFHVKQWDSIAVNTNTNKVYATSTNSPNLLVIDGSSNTLVRTIQLPDYPAKISINPTTNKIYILPENSYEVTVINGSSDSILDKISLPIPKIYKLPPPPLNSIHVNPVTNTIYVATGDYESLIAINGTSDTLMKVIPGVGNSDIAIDPVYNKIFTSSYDSFGVIINSTSNSVIGTSEFLIMGPTVVDPHTHTIYDARLGIVGDISSKVKSTLNLPYDKNSTDLNPGIAINLQTDMIYLKPLNSNVISIINGSSDSIIGKIPIGTIYSMDVNPNTNKLYVNSDDEIHVIDTTSNKLIGTIPINSTVPEFGITSSTILAVAVITIITITMVLRQKFSLYK
jgi:DNA-binding beta-propeller fold protein YncE